jgi:4-azaleucine resistance transporter AzlC
MSGKSSWLSGVKAGLPIALGYFPIAIAFGALAGQAQLAWTEATLMSLIVYAGASQFVSVSMLLSGAGTVQIITTTLFLNMRHLIMSLAVNDQIRDFSLARKSFLSFFITDETFALLTLGEVDVNAYDRSPSYLSGLLLTAYFGWVTGSAVGALGSGLIPEEITTAVIAGLYGLFIGLLVPPVRKSLRYALIAVAAMALNWLLIQFLDQGWSIVIATVLSAGWGSVLLKEEV